MPFITSEDMTGKGERVWGNDMQQRTLGGGQTYGHCRGLTASVYGANALPIDLPGHQVQNNLSDKCATVVILTCIMCHVRMGKFTEVATITKGGWGLLNGQFQDFLFLIIRECLMFNWLTTIIFVT